MSILHYARSTSWCEFWVEGLWWWHRRLLPGHISSPRVLRLSFNWSNRPPLAYHYKTFHCGNDKLTPTLVGIVSVFQNLRSTLLLPFHSVSYLPPPRGTLTGMVDAWVWSLANVTAKASCSRSPCVWVNGMFNALVWSFNFDLRDMSTEVWVFALLSLLFIEWRLCFDGVDWLFLFASCFLIGSFSWVLIG